MLGNLLTRRAALAALVAFSAAGFSGCNTTPSGGSPPAVAAGGGAIDVDTSPLVAYVGNPTAGWVQQSLPGALAQVLVGAPGGLHVRIDTLYLGNGGPADPDRMRGVATLGGRTIKVGRSRPIFRARPIRRCRNRLCRAACRLSSVAFAYRLRQRLGRDAMTPLSARA